METIIYNPYNPSNIPITKNIIINIFKKADIDVSNKEINLEIFQISLTHKSYSIKQLDEGVILAENTNKCVELQKENNERIEMLGDRVFDLVIVDYIYHRYPKQNEGFLTILKTKIVSSEFMAEYSNFLNLGKYILMSKQIEYKETRTSQTILENTFEAFIGACYLQFGFDILKKFIIYIIEECLDFADIIYHDKNYKDILIKYYQKMKYKPLRFIEEIINNGTQMSRLYTIIIKDNDNNILGKGTDKVKKKAEQIASHNVLIKLGISK